MHSVYAFTTHVHTFAAKSMAGMWQSMETPGQQRAVQKKHPMKETIDRISDLSPFECMALCKVDNAMVL